MQVMKGLIKTVIILIPKSVNKSSLNRLLQEDVQKTFNNKLFRNVLL